MKMDEFIDVRFYSGDLYFFRHVKGKGIDQQAFCHLFPNTSCTQIKEGFLAELPYGRAMAALHIVRKDLQLRFGIYRGFVADDQVIVLLEALVFCASLCT